MCGASTPPRHFCSAAVGLLAGEGLALVGLLAAAFVLGANLALRPIVHAINRQPIESTEEGQHYFVSIDCRAAGASHIRSLLIQEFAAVPDVHFREVDSTFIQSSGRVEVTATLTSHKPRGLALETIVTRLCETDGILRASWREQAHSS